MKIILFIALSFCVSVVDAQKMEVFGGINRNRFFDFMEENPHQSSTYVSDDGFCLGLALDSIASDDIWFRLSIQYDKYRGGLKATSGGLGGGTTNSARVKKSVLSFCFFPFNFRMLDKKVDVNLGLMFSVLVDEAYSGTSSGWQTSTPSSPGSAWNSELKNLSSSQSLFGVQGRFAYKIKISNSIFITPQYQFYVGFTNEYMNFFHTKSFRNYLCIGFAKSL